MAKVRLGQVFELRHHPALIFVTGVLGVMISPVFLAMAWSSRADARYVATHPALEATIADIRRVKEGRFARYDVFVEYPADATGAAKCRVLLAPGDVGWPAVVGQTLQIVPRDVPCYEPIIPGRIDHGLDELQAGLITLVGGVACVATTWSALTRSDRRRVA